MNLLIRYVIRIKEVNKPFPYFLNGLIVISVFNQHNIIPLIMEFNKQYIKEQFEFAVLEQEIVSII